MMLGRVRSFVTNPTSTEKTSVTDVSEAPGWGFTTRGSGAHGARPPPEVGPHREAPGTPEPPPLGLPCHSHNYTNTLSLTIIRFGCDFSRPTNAQHVRKRANLWSAWAALCSSRSVLCLLSRHHHHHPALLRLHRSQHQRSLFRKSQCFLNRRHRHRGMLHT
jgi:hypothetical protein